jgi:hypothetical protein
MVGEGDAPAAVPAQPAAAAAAAAMEVVEIKDDDGEGDVDEGEGEDAVEYGHGDAAAAAALPDYRLVPLDSLISPCAASSSPGAVAVVRGFAVKLYRFKVLPPSSSSSQHLFDIILGLDDGLGMQPVHLHPALAQAFLCCPASALATASAKARGEDCMKKLQAFSGLFVAIHKPYVEARGGSQLSQGSSAASAASTGGRQQQQQQAVDTCRIQLASAVCYHSTEMQSTLGQESSRQMVAALCRQLLRRASS